jgi:hypothetical protein
MQSICSKKLKSLQSNKVFDLQVFVCFHSIAFAASNCNKLTMVNRIVLQQKSGQQLQHNGASSCITMAMEISEISKSFRVLDLGKCDVRERATTFEI